ncbi:hypothetical protein DdX_16686 [Ditylenchus destructor]|uniref:Uncharacterized protein n=1 Tax=Ditylenchus destructor TaxID=166010 RepID=A0AAD4MNJ7_9BILA|nr:hypothetical protein DdX_16686 [Ditylenchus destructor]
MILSSSTIFLLITSTALTVVQLTQVTSSVDPCSNSTILAKDVSGNKTDLAKASIQLSRANAAIASLQAKYNVKTSIHDAKLKIFNHAIVTRDQAESERKYASDAINETEKKISRYQDEHIEAIVQARNPTMPYKSRTRYETRHYYYYESRYETITDHDRALVKAAQDKAIWHNLLLKAKSDLAKEKATFNHKDRLFTLAEGNMKRAKEAFQAAKLAMESAENELNEAKSVRDSAKILYDAAVQSKTGSKKSADSPECKPKYQRYG